MYLSIAASRLPLASAFMPSIHMLYASLHITILMGIM